jgi:hypothetical protein
MFSTKFRSTKVRSTKVRSTKVRFCKSSVCSKAIFYQISFYQSPDLLPKSGSTKVHSTKVRICWNVFYQSPVLPKSSLFENGILQLFRSTKVSPTVSNIISLIFGQPWWRVQERELGLWALYRMYLVRSCRICIDEMGMSQDANVIPNGRRGCQLDCDVWTGKCITPLQMLHRQGVLFVRSDVWGVTTQERHGVQLVAGEMPLWNWFNVQGAS